MGMNITEKILARASGKSSCAPGEIVEAAIDVAMLHDNRHARHPVAAKHPLTSNIGPAIHSTCRKQCLIPTNLNLRLLFI